VHALRLRLLSKPKLSKGSRVAARMWLPAKSTDARKPGPLWKPFARLSPAFQAIDPANVLSGKRVMQNIGVNIGYARVSTEEQNLDLQRQALEAAGCEKIFEDHGVSGAAVERPGLTGALAAAQSGDVLVVWKLDRLGRSLPHLIDVITGLRDAGIGFRSLQEQIDTTSAGGRFYFHMLAALAEFERELIGERTTAGMASARRRGKHVGRPRKLTPQQLAHARELIESGEETRAGVAALFGVNVTTLRRGLQSRDIVSRRQ
jgi:DNA invertase Pin-like site-specific DNA recombinase